MTGSAARNRVRAWSGPAGARVPLGSWVSGCQRWRRATEDLVRASRNAPSAIVAGSALDSLASPGGTARLTAARRRQLHLSYTRRDLPQQLIQRNYVTSELFNRLSEAQRYLLDLT